MSRLLTWEEWYERAEEYFKKYGDLEVPKNYKTNDGYNLGIWIANQRRTCIPETDRCKLLLKIGMRFKTRKKSKKTWDEMYEKAVEYYNVYGNLEVPQKYTSDGFNLGTWISTQRKDCSPESERGKLLSKIEMRFETKKNIPWEEMYEYAKKYYETYGNLEITSTFKTNDGITYDENGSINLGMWLHKQRERCDSESKRGKLLSSIGMRFETKEILPWDEMYKYAVEYYRQYGNLEVPQTFKTSDGLNLGMWILTQRYNCNPKSIRGQLLLNIGMKFETKKNIPWEEMYKYAKKYYEAYGNLEVLYKFKTNDGITYAEDGSINLGAWISKQRYNCNSESERGKLLSNIGMKFRNNTAGHFNYKLEELNWLKMYTYSMKYYEQYGNLDVSSTFSIESGDNIGSWIRYQRVKYRKGTLSSEKISMLESIGMIWDVRKNRYNILILCEEYCIDVDKNSKILKCISCIELKVKLFYLKNNGMSFVDMNGFLHEIFSMSSVDMKMKYGVCLADLVELYNKNVIK